MFFLKFFRYFCSSCSATVKRTASFCWSCGNKLDGPPNPPVAAYTFTPSTLAPSTPTGLFGRPPAAKVKTLAAYKAIKTSQRLQGSDFKQNKKAKVSPTDPVTINAGIKHLSGNTLKTMWSKKLPLQVPRNANYKLILDKAVNKLKAHFSRQIDFWKDTTSFVLCYEDGSQAQFLPGTSNFFELTKYKEELGKDFKRITLFVCTEIEYNHAEKYFMYGESESESDSEEDKNDNSSSSVGCIGSLNENPFDNSLSELDYLGDFNNPSSPSPSTSVEVTSDLGKDAHNESGGRSASCTATSTSSCNTVFASCTATPTTTIHTMDPQGISNGTVTDNTDPQDETNDTLEDIYRNLNSKVNNEGNTFFIVARRMAPLSRTLALWERQSKKNPVTQVVQVHYSGEDGIDSGAIAKEFFRTTLDDIGSDMFPSGSPVDFMFHVQNGHFRICGEMVAASLAQGGPVPQFLDQAAYDSMVSDIPDFENIDDSNLTRAEQETLAAIAKDPLDKAALIYENGYLGTIKQENLEAILKCVKASLVSRRQLYMKQFMKGLDSYGLEDIIKQNPKVSEAMFVIGRAAFTLPDANYLFSLMVPTYSEKGSTKQALEVKVMDHLQDLLIKIEDAETKELCVMLQ